MMSKSPLASAGLYMLLTTALLIALNAYISQSSIYRAKSIKIDRNYASPAARADTRCEDSSTQALVIGNSYVAESFIDPQRPCDYQFFLVSGMPLSDLLSILQNLPREPAFKHVYLGLGYNFANPVKTDSSMYQTHWRTNPVSRAWAALPMVRGRSNTSTMLRQDIKCLLSPPACPPSQNTPPSADNPHVETEVEAGTQAALSLKAQQHALEMKRSIKARYREYVPYTAHVSAEFGQKLQALNTIAKQRGWQLITYTAPIHPELHAQLSADFIKTFHASIQAQGLNYTDLNEVEYTWQNSDFDDATHTSAQGAKRVTRMLLGNR